MSASTVTTKDGTRIFYKDWGPKTAPPVVFHHGWPLSSQPNRVRPAGTPSASPVPGAC